MNENKGALQLKQYFKTLNFEQRKLFAAKCGTTPGNLIQMIYGRTGCSASLAIEIDRESGGVVRCDDLCPKADFNYIRKQKNIEFIT